MIGNVVAGVALLGQKQLEDLHANERHGSPEIGTKTRFRALMER